MTELVAVLLRPTSRLTSNLGKTLTSSSTPSSLVFYPKNQETHPLETRFVQSNYALVMTHPP